MQLDSSKGLEYLKYRDLVLQAYYHACDDSSRYFALDQATEGNLEKRIKSIEDHFDQLVFWRCEEIFDQLPEELIPKTSRELEKLMQFLNSLDPCQPINFKGV